MWPIPPNDGDTCYNELYNTRVLVTLLVCLASERVFAFMLGMIEWMVR